MTYFKRKARLLVFIGSLRAGGKERRLIELLTYLDKTERFDILVVTTRDEIHYQEFYKLNIGYKIIRKTWKRNDVSVFWKLYKIARQFNPDIIHAWGRMQAFYAIPIVIGQNRPLVNSQITGAPTRRRKWTSGWLIDQLNFLFSSIVLSNSKAGLDTFKPPANKQRLIYNGINLSRFENLPATGEIKRKYGIATEHAVVMIASYTPTKDYALFFELAAKVTAFRNDITFIGAGGCNRDDAEYQRMLHASAGNPQIRFLAQIHDVEALVNACDIGVLFSTNAEGLSNAILEYMALGKPVIANDAGGTCELIKNGVNGYLFTGRNSDEIARRLIELIDQPLKAASFGIISRRQVLETFSIAGMGQAFEDVYKEVLPLENVSKILPHPIFTDKV